MHHSVMVKKSKAIVAVHAELLTSSRKYDIDIWLVKAGSLGHSLCTLSLAP